MRSLKVCKKCDHYSEIKSEYSLTKDSEIIKRINCHCEIDESGLTRTATSLKFVNAKTQPKDYEKLPVPEKCPMRMEHLVIMDGNDE